MDEQQLVNQCVLSGGNLGGTITSTEGWNIGEVKNFYSEEDKRELQYRRDTEFQAVLVGYA